MCHLTVEGHAISPEAIEAEHCSLTLLTILWTSFCRSYMQKATLRICMCRHSYLLRVTFAGSPLPYAACTHCPVLCRSTDSLQHMATSGFHAKSFDPEHEMLTISMTLPWLDHASVL